MDDVIRVLQLEPSGALMVINVLLEIYCAHTRLSNNGRISNGISLTGGL